MHARINARGFTLIELVAGLAVAATIAALATPGFTLIWANYRGASASSELATALAYARIAAVTRNEAVTLCPSSDGWRCTGTSDWSTGWIAYLDGRRDDQPGTAGAVLLRSGIAPRGVRLNSTGGRRYVRFQPTGWASGTNLTINVCAASKPWGRVILNNAGRARVARGPANCRQA